MKTIAAIVLCLALSPAYAMTYCLVADWYENGNHMCKYSNGTVLNVSYNICPLSIEG